MIHTKNFQTLLPTALLGLRTNLANVYHVVVVHGVFGVGLQETCIPISVPNPSTSRLGLCAWPWEFLLGPLDRLGSTWLLCIQLHEGIR